MLRFLTSFLVPAALAAACATSSPIRQGGSGGGGGAQAGASSSSGVLASGDGGARGCGVGDNDPACNSCIYADCCGPAEFCARDATCLGCLGQPTPSEACTLDHLFATFEGCLQARCAERCGLTGGGGGQGGAQGGSGGSAGTSTTASSTTGSSTSASSSTSSSSGASSSSSASSSSGASPSGSSSSSGGMLTCAEVDGDVGCCDAEGVLHFCTFMQDEQDQPCTNGTVCGWSSFHGYYDCVSPPGGSSDVYPIACGGP